MHFNTLKFRILISIIGIVTLSLVATISFFLLETKEELSESLEDNALRVLDATKYHVESQYNSINYHKSIMIARRKEELKNAVSIATSAINEIYRDFKKGEIGENEAKRKAISLVKNLRYGDGVGYFWINDTTFPYPKMIMHPTMPELDGKILDAPEFNCALGINENLFVAFVNVCIEDGEGYVDYLWPKPIDGGLTEKQPKISYVKLFEPWMWITGSGVYITDIEKDVRDRLDAVINDLNKTILKQKIGESGYFFIFDENNRMLVHPNLAYTDGNMIINPKTQNRLLEEIKAIESASKNSIEYFWDKPRDEGNFNFLKKTFVTKFEPLGWYICSSVYKEDYEKKINSLTNTVIISSVAFLLVAIIISLLLSNSIANPLIMLINSIGKTDKDGIPVDRVPEKGTKETIKLGATINKMLSSISRSREELIAERDFSMGIINGSPFLVCGLDANGIIKFINPAGEKTTGYQKNEIIGQNGWNLFLSKGEKKQLKEICTDSIVDSVFDYEMTMTSKDGEKKWISWNSFSQRGSSNAWEIILTGVDITERKEQAGDLAKLRNYLANIIDSMPSLLVGVDREGRVTQWNKMAEETTGIPAQDAQGKSLSNIFPRMASKMNRIAESIRDREIKFERKIGTTVKNATCFEDITIYPLIANGVEGAVIRIDDVTEKVRMEEMMIQSEKMLSVGGLAAGMAHEINNPLAGMLQTAKVMKNRLVTQVDMPANLKAAEEVEISVDALKAFMEMRGIPRMLNTIEESGGRVADIINNMLSFARKSDSTVSSPSLPALIDKTLELAATDYDLKKQYDFKRIEIVRSYEPGVPVVPCEESKMQQVLLNVFRNAAQALQDAGTENPRLTVGTRFLQEKRMVAIEIEDNGPGMSEEIRKRIFEPFFTTKPPGVGTGLGLSVSYFIITENHGGEMSVESLPGKGSKFIIRLPGEGRPA